MKSNFTKKIRLLLMRHKTNLVEWMKNGSQNQYPGLAQNSENPDILSKIETALDQVEQGSFGKCLKCSGEVEKERLMLDFTTCVCLDHYSPEQIRELERDLEVAAQVQQHLLPGSLPVIEGLQIAAMARPAGAVGGDYYDFFRFREHHQGFAIADVMGKGVSAGMLMANLQASLRIMGPNFHDLLPLIRKINELFRYNLKQVRFITLFLAGYDPHKKVIQYVNAGHHPPLLWNTHTKKQQWLKPTGPAIGLVPEASFTSETVGLAKGDLLVMYTDGLVEARNGKHEEFGEERLAQYTSTNAQKSPQSFLSGLLSELDTFGGILKDDLTMMVLKAA